MSARTHLIDKLLVVGGLGLAAACHRQADTPSLRLVKVMEASGDTVDLVGPDIAAPAPHHGLYLSRQASSNLVEEIDSTGHFVRTFGRLGNGPGEYSNAALVVARDNRVAIVDGFTSVVQMYDSVGGFLRSINTPFGALQRMLLLPGDTMVVADLVYDTASFGLPIHIAAPDGHILRSFGTDDRSITQTNTVKFMRSLGRASDTSFWAAHSASYTLDLWSIRGHQLNRLTPRRSWFPVPRAEQDEQPIWLARPIPKVLAIHDAGSGRLYVLLRRARSDWHIGPGPAERISLMYSMQYLEEVLELVDSNSGALIASTVIRTDPVLGFLDPSHVYGIHEAEDGRVYPVIWSIARDSS